MVTFHLHRNQDASGVSGTGIVAQGVQFDNGLIALTWLVKPTSVSVYGSLKDVERIHGHGGKTELIVHPRGHTCTVGKRKGT
jgi:hypothetical protein